MPREGIAVWKSSSFVVIANVIIAIIVVIWCSSGSISAFRTLEENKSPSTAFTALQLH